MATMLALSDCTRYWPGTSNQWYNATCNPNSTATISAQPILNSWCSPTLKPSAHFHTAQKEPTIIPIPKEELTSPHQLRSNSCGGANGTHLGAWSRIKDTLLRLALTWGGGACQALNERKDDAKYEREWRKGWINGKMHEMWISLPCKLAASLAVKQPDPKCHNERHWLIAIILSLGRPTDLEAKSQLNPM